MGLTEAWDPERGIPVRLVFERAEALEITLPVAAGPAAASAHGHPPAAGHGDLPASGAAPGGHGH
jgi:hypothetical protein